MASPAFDKIEWKFIFKTREKYIKNVKLLYNDSSSCCINNGWSSEFFHLGRGVRQGCPLSPYLFILCAEILGNAIRNDESVHGIQIKNDNSEVTTKLSQYADDTTLFLDGQPQSIIAVVQLCKEFEQISGLKINESKTKAACVGNLYYMYQYDEMKSKLTKLDWVSEKIHLLGMDIPIKSDVKNLIDWNLRSKLKESKSVFNKWKRHKLTLYGKSMVIKSYGGSALSFFLSVVPTPDETFFNEYNDIMKDFLWDSSSTKIKIETLYKDYEEGGIRLLNLKAFDQSLKLKWLKYLHGNNTNSLHILMSRYITKIIEVNWQINISTKDIKYVLNSCKYKFVETILKAWVEINYKQITPLTDVNELMHQCIWFFECKINLNMVSKHILNVRDLMKSRNTFFSYAEVCDRYNCQFNIMDYNSLMSAIPWKNRLKEQHDPSNRIQDHLYDKIVHKQEGLCKFLYK